MPGGPPAPAALEAVLVEREPSPLATVVGALASACVEIAGAVATSPLTGLARRLDGRNVHGEVLRQLDRLADSAVAEALGATGLVAAGVSEEAEQLVVFPRTAGPSYVVNWDPLDGSARIDANGSLGTIFSILPFRGGEPEEACLQPGSRQLLAGYALYGASTMLVLASRRGVQAFTLEPASRTFLLTHGDVETPARAAFYSANEGNWDDWDERVRRYVAGLKGEDRGYRLRYGGALVADFHRTLVEGGIFFYPADRRRPQGKIRHLYEASPLAFVAEAAGGAASDGRRPISRLRPSGIHDRVPFVAGGASDVAEYQKFLAGNPEPDSGPQPLP